MQKTGKPIKQVAYDGYRKFIHKKLGKLYVGVLTGGMPKKQRVLRWFHKRARDAEAYARAVAERWERVFGTRPPSPALLPSEERGQGKGVDDFE